MATDAMTDDDSFLIALLFVVLGQKKTMVRVLRKTLSFSNFTDTVDC